MARQVVPVFDASDPFPDAGLNFGGGTNAIVADKEQAVLDERLLIVVWNSDGTNPHTVTITSAPNAQKRTNDLVDVVASTAYRIYGPFERDGWVQPGGNLFFEADAPQIKYFVMKV